MKIYLASSWRNNRHDQLKKAIQEAGVQAEIFDYREHTRFKWELVADNWKKWSTDEFVDVLTKDPTVARAYISDFSGIKSCDVLVALATNGIDAKTGVSVSVEIGMALALGKRVIVLAENWTHYCPELMLQPAYFTDTIDGVCAKLRLWYEHDDLFHADDEETRLEIKFKKIRQDGWLEPQTPYHAHKTDRGFDLVAVAVEQVANYIWRYHSGLAFQFPKGVDAELRARSSIWKTGLVLSNGIGTIDNGYTGEVQGVFYELILDTKTKYRPGDRFAQLVIPSIDPAKIEFMEVDNLHKTERGDGGYGSTGK